MMKEISLEKAKKIAEERGLFPGKVKDYERVVLTDGKSDRVERIDWDDFERLLKKRGLALYDSGGWMKIMKKK